MLSTVLVRLSATDTMAKKRTKQAMVPKVVCKGSNLVAEATPTSIDVQASRPQAISTRVTERVFDDEGVGRSSWWVTVGKVVSSLV